MSENAAPILCQKCGKIFKAKRTLSIHQKNPCKPPGSDSSSDTKFVCECGNTYNSLKNLRDHQSRFCLGRVEKDQLLEHKDDSDEFKCMRCERIYNSGAALSQHQRRYCKHHADNKGFYACTYNCPRQFDTLIGLRQHIRHTHPMQYDKEVQHLQVKQGWTSVEIAEMAEAEATFKGKKINEFLKTKIKRTLDSIKGKRRDPIYRELVRKAKERKNLNHKPNRLILFLAR